MNEIILIDKEDNQIGTEEKIKVHKMGYLHRAFSIFVFNNKGEMLLQQRAFNKYHSGGLWSNTCCSHPHQNETTLLSAHKRLIEEMGIDCELTEIFSFGYKATFDNGLIENEIDHVFIGNCDDIPIINSEEANDYRWIKISDLKSEIKRHPEIFTEWFKICLKQVINHITKKTILNYIGQLRIYSLIDLMLLLFAVKANLCEFLGAILLHVGSLAYLESKHKDLGRKRVPDFAWIILGGFGIILFGHILAIIGYIIASILYTRKKKSYWGVFAPAMRGLQNCFIVGGIIGFLNPLTLIVFFALFFRNLLGDFRDIKKDRKEGVKTIPVILGIKKDHEIVHLFALFGTSFLWLSLMGLRIDTLASIFIAVFSIQALNYGLTPR